MKQLLLGVFITICSLFVTANVPAPYWPCNGKKEGDPCKWGYGCRTNQTCKLIQGCNDDPRTEVNECLHCRD